MRTPDGDVMRGPMITVVPPQTVAPTGPVLDSVEFVNEGGEWILQIRGQRLTHERERTWVQIGGGLAETILESATEVKARMVQGCRPGPVILSVGEESVTGPALGIPGDPHVAGYEPATVRPRDEVRLIVGQRLENVEQVSVGDRVDRERR